MKKTLLITFLSFVVLIAKAQQFTPPAKNDTTLHRDAEIEPVFDGGMQKFYQYVTTNLKVNGNKGRVAVTFIVEKDGSLSHIAVARGLSDSADKEVIRLMKESPKWIPASIKGIPVRVRYTVPISFK